MRFILSGLFLAIVSLVFIGCDGGRLGYGYGYGGWYVIRPAPTYYHHHHHHRHHRHRRSAFELNDMRIAKNLDFIATPVSAGSVNIVAPNDTQPALDFETSVQLLSRDFNIRTDSAATVLNLLLTYDPEALAKAGIEERDFLPLADLKMPSSESITRISERLLEPDSKIRAMMAGFISDVAADSEGEMQAEQADFEIRSEIENQVLGRQEI